MKSILFGNLAVTFTDAVYISIVSMLIVFFILFLISFMLSFFKYFSNFEGRSKDSKKTNDNKVMKKTEKLSNEGKLDKKETFNMEKIKDETMMAAMMAALIEAAGDNKNSRIKIRNIREIK